MADNDCEVIEGLERDWRDALCRKDMDRLRTLVHPEFVLIGTRSTNSVRQMNSACLLCAISQKRS